LTYLTDYTYRLALDNYYLRDIGHGSIADEGDSRTSMELAEVRKARIVELNVQVDTLMIENNELKKERAQAQAKRSKSLATAIVAALVVVGGSISVAGSILVDPFFVPAAISGVMAVALSAGTLFYLFLLSREVFLYVRDGVERHIR